MITPTTIITYTFDVVMLCSGDAQTTIELQVNQFDLVNHRPADLTAGAFLTARGFGCLGIHLIYQK